MNDEKEVTYRPIDSWLKSEGCKTLYALAKKLKVHQSSMQCMYRNGTYIGVLKKDTDRPEVYTARLVKSTHE